MTTALLVVAVAAALACPAHMLWRMRRGRGASCAPSRESADSGSELRARQRALAARIEQLRG
jgi:hypothetical protein